MPGMRKRSPMPDPCTMLPIESSRLLPARSGCEVVVVERDDEPGRTALRRDVGGAVGRGGADEHEG
jgi:hypothetical protein